MSRKKEVFAFHDCIDGWDERLQLIRFIQNTLQKGSISPANKFALASALQQFQINNRIDERRLLTLSSAIISMNAQGSAFTRLLHDLLSCLVEMEKKVIFRYDPHKFAYHLKQNITHDPIHRRLHIKIGQRWMQYGITQQWHLQILKAMLIHKYEDPNIVLLRETDSIYLYHFPDQQKIDEILQASQCIAFNETENSLIIDLPTLSHQFIDFHTNTVKYIINVYIARHYQQKGVVYNSIVNINDVQATQSGSRIFATYIDTEYRDIKPLQVIIDDETTILL